MLTTCGDSGKYKVVSTILYRMLTHHSVQKATNPDVAHDESDLDYCEKDRFQYFQEVFIFGLCLGP
jgi:hypothetical protein